MTGGLLLRMAAYTFAVAAILVVCRLKRLPLRETLGLYLPRARPALLFSLLFVCLVAGEEWLAGALGLPPTSKWHDMGLGALLVRAFAAAILAPAAEELLFRGLLYTRVSKTRLRAGGAIVLTALLFTAAHYDKPLGAGAYVALAQIFVDGLYFGLVRYKTNSTLLTILLHAAGNAFAVFQRMP